MLIQNQIFKQNAVTLIDEVTGIELGEVQQDGNSFFLLYFGHGTFELESRDAAMSKAKELSMLEAYVPRAEKQNVNQFNLF